MDTTGDAPTESGPEIGTDPTGWPATRWRGVVGLVAIGAVSSPLLFEPAAELLSRYGRYVAGAAVVVGIMVAWHQRWRAADARRV